MFEETPSVRMKGVGDSLWVTVAPEATLEVIQAELTRLFEPLKHLAGTTRVVLDTGASREDDPRNLHIRTYLRDVFNLNQIVSPSERNGGKEKRYNMKNSRSIISHYRDDTLVLAGRVRSGQSVQAKKHLVIMGDVNPGSELTAGGDILVIGSLCGRAAAGQPDNRDAIILALDFRPLQVMIGEVVAAGLPSAGQGKPEFAHLEDGAIIVDDYQTANPFRRIPWPVVR
jgi:septum site-determining protein MinC